MPDCAVNPQTLVILHGGKEGLQGVGELRQPGCALAAGKQPSRLQVAPQLMRLLRELAFGAAGEHCATLLCGELAEK